MLKHMLTAACNRDCSYCITRNVHLRQELDLWKVEDVYSRMAGPEIMLTGGEPSIAANFERIIILANEYFGKVFITTQNPVMLQPRASFPFAAITFSLHDENTPFAGSSSVPVFASIMARRYSVELIDLCIKLGYSGLTVNEDHRGSDGQFTAEFPDRPGFSMRVNRCGKCVTGETIILPDLSITDDFRPFL